MSGTFQPGQSINFKVFMGNRGSKRGTFTCVDQRFLAPSEYVVATLICKDTRGKIRKTRVKLTERC